jgi:predicted NBD/HSP70 family sugar kinase
MAQRAALPYTGGMYLGIDVGGTKTLVASLTNEGVITESTKFPTPKNYHEFTLQLKEAISGLHTKEFRAGGIAIPGLVDRKHGTGIAFGNLPWAHVPVQADVERMIHAPVVIENDANAAALSEAMLLKHDYSVVIYVTIGTGIGTGIIVDQKIDKAFEDTEGGYMLLDHKGKLVQWQKIASGRAIFERFGKRASDINDEKTWKLISRDIARGLIELIAMAPPDVIVIGGGIGTHFHKYEKWLNAELKKYETPLTPVPPIRQAQRPEEAVVYGCFDLAKERYGHSAR